MKIIDKIFGRVIGWGTFLAGMFLCIIMILIVLDIILRLMKIPVIGSYEITQLFIVVTVAFALPYTAYMKGHVVIDIITSHFNKRIRSVISIAAGFLGLATWALIGWAALGMLQEKWSGEYSFTLKLPYLPFRFAWVIGLFLFCLIYILDLVKAVRATGRQE